MHKIFTSLPLSLSLLWTVQTTSAINAKPDAAATPLEIVADGKPKAQIVVAGERPRMVTLAALELQSFLEKISGARLPIVTSPTEALPIKIYVGKSPGTDKLGVTAEGLKHGAYRMVSGQDWLVLIGRDFDFDPLFKPWPMSRQDNEKSKAAWEDAIKGKTDTGWGFPFGGYKEIWAPRDYNKIMAEHYGKDNASLWEPREGQPAGFWEFDEGGSLNAVYGFLSKLGVRWYMPGALGQVIPEKKTIVVGPVNETSIPDFAMRGWIWYGFLGFSFDDLIWARQLGMNSGYEKIGPLRGPHGLTNVHSHPAMKKARPEYYALIGGERDTEHRGYGTPNFLSEGLQQETVNYIRFLFDKYDLPAVDIWPVDGIMMSEDEASQGKSVSELVWGFTDRVAREVYKTHPDRFIIGGAYSTYSSPPDTIEKFSPNLVVNISNAGRLNFEDPEAWERYQKLVKAWESRVAPGNILRYENNRSGLSEPFVFPVIHPRAIVKDLQSLKGKTMGERGEVSQKKQQWQKPGNIHLPLYVQARFLWDADQNIDEVLDEYYRLFYGPAAAKMEKAFTYAEEVQLRRGPSRKGDPGEGYRPFEASIRYRELLEEARKAAGDSVYGKRIDLLISELQPKDKFIAEYKAREAAIAEFRAKAPVALGVEGADLSKAEVYTLRDSHSGEEIEPKTSFKVGWEDNHLIFDITCQEPKMENISVTSDVYGGDYVAISLDTPLHSFYHIEVNPDGLVADGDPGPKNSSWKSLSAVRTERGKDFWRVVVRIPVVDAAEADSDPMHRVAGEKPTTEKPWYFNVGRNRMLGARKAQTQAFSPTGGNWRTPIRFGRLEIQ